MSAADAKAYKEKMISAGDSWRAKFKTMTPAEQKAWSQKQKATRQDDFKRLEKNVGRGQGGGGGPDAPSGDMGWSPRKGTGRTCKDGYYWNAYAGDYVCLGDEIGGARDTTNHKMLQSYLSKLNQNLQLQAFILGLFEKVEVGIGDQLDENQRQFAEDASDVFGGGKNCIFPALKFTIKKMNFKVLYVYYCLG